MRPNQEIGRLWELMVTIFVNIPKVEIIKHDPIRVRRDEPGERFYCHPKYYRLHYDGQPFCSVCLHRFLGLGLGAFLCSARGSDTRFHDRSSSAQTVIHML